MNEGKKVFERGGISGSEERLKGENRRLKAMIGDTTKGGRGGATSAADQDRQTSGIFAVKYHALRLHSG